MNEATAAPAARAKAGGRRAAMTRRTIRAFLDHLAATCHVRGAAAAAGVSASALYKLRRSDPGFAEAWRDAVQAGYDRLEEALLARALREVGAEAIDAGAVTLELVDVGDAAPAPDAAGTPRRRAGMETCAGLSGKVARIDVQLALTLLNRRAAVDARGRDRHGRRRPSAEEVERALTTKLDVLARQLNAPAA